ncbi:alpha/beta hydrolase [Flagellimonas nanhaiensis]|uniref:Alpha/beta fold hydrolase n=1 Tax=Flagellimonas nanhaiensis TaxID=2292706 RepID=A0A371JUX2_9FLAO|nr:alpha/beta fold hydrolase [Allomuricauda nanhaiensis]RDY61615.1 alpha/beta fold hydrolase [Allomuricauda nanhaiensis]
MQKLKRLVLYGLILLALITTMLYLLQERLIFLPTKLPQDYAYTFNVEFEELFLETSDGARLNALHFYADNPKGLILYFHGNAGDLSRWGEIVSRFTDFNYDVLVMDYRTYGKSTGKISEKVLYDDAKLFYEHALKNYDESELIIYGRSLGTGIATNLASTSSPKMLVLETPFYSLMDVASERFPYLPTKHFLKYKIPSFEHVQDVEVPIYIFHGTEDEVVSYESGRKLFEAIPHSNKRMFTIENGAHNNLSEFDEYWDKLKIVLD